MFHRPALARYNRSLKTRDAANAQQEPPAPQTVLKGAPAYCRALQGAPGMRTFALLLDAVCHDSASARRQFRSEAALVVALRDGQQQLIVGRSIGELELRVDLGGQPLPAERPARRRDFACHRLELQRSLDRVDRPAGIPDGLVRSSSAFGAIFDLHEAPMHVAHRLRSAVGSHVRDRQTGGSAANSAW